MRSRLMLFVGAALAVTLAGAAQAANIYSTSFEPLTFIPGPIAGQGGWQVFSASGQPNSALVEAGVALTGTQAAVVDGSVAAQTGPYYTLNLASPGVIDLSGDIMLTTAAGAAQWQFAAIGPGLVGFAGGIDITSAGNILAISGAFPVIGSFSSNVWHHVDIILDYPTQTFDVKLDGLTLASEMAFCGSNGACTGAPVPIFGVGIFDSFGGATSFAPGYLDNFSIATVPTGVPEPAAWSLLIGGFAMAGGALRRRRAAVRAN